MSKAAPSLDERIATALGNGEVIAVADMQALLAEIESDIRENHKLSEQERERALDPTAAPSDAQGAAQRADAAVLKCQRYARALVRLREKLTEALHAERCAAWHIDADKIDAMTDAVTDKLFRYVELADEIVTLLLEAESANREVDRVNGSAPDGELRRLTRVQLSHLQDLVLPAWDGSGHNLWPQRGAPSLAQAYAEISGMAVPAHPGADWAKAMEARTEAIHAEQQRLADYYAKLTREQEERWHAEERQRFEKAQRRRQR